MASMMEKKCERCGQPMTVRAADVKRGWGRFCSKSCKASAQESRTHQFYNYKNSGVDRDTYLRYAKDRGGTPQFDRNGDFEGISFNVGKQPE